MKRKLVIGLATTVALLSGCNSIATRNAPLEELPHSSIETAITGMKSSQSLAWHIKDVRVTVPESLTVSEANLYLPNSDIVWREDPFGDRRAQVRDILDLAVSQAALNLNGTEPVYLDIELKRFHALSQKARVSVGGTHAIVFEVCIRDVHTNVELIDPFPIEIKLKAFGGNKALKAEMRGETQKVRITREITSVMRKYLGM